MFAWKYICIGQKGLRVMFDLLGQVPVLRIALNIWAAQPLQCSHSSFCAILLKIYSFDVYSGGHKTLHGWFIDCLYSSLFYKEKSWNASEICT